MKGPTPLRIHHVEDDDFLDSNIIIYELPVGEKGKPGDDSVHVFTGHKAELYPAAWSPTAARLAATGGGDNSAFLWRIGQGYWDFELREEPVDDSVHVFAGHEAELYPSACSPTAARLVATGGGDNSAFLWRIGQGDWDFELRGHEDSVCSLAFSSDGQRLASGCLGGLVRIWDTQSGNLKCSLEGSEMLTEWIRWHPAGPMVLAGSADATVCMWDADTGACLNTFSGKGGNAICGDFTPDGKLVCTGSDDAILRIWDTKSGENIHVIGGHPYHKEGITDLAISPDSTCALTGSYDGSVCIVNITTGRVIGKLGSHTDSIQCAGFAPNQGPSSNWAATGGMDKKLIIWDLQHSMPRSICEHEDRVTCLTWLGASNYLATGCFDRKVRVWDCRSGECVRTFSGHAGPINSLSASASCDFLVSVSHYDKTARVFDILEFQ